MPTLRRLAELAGKARLIRVSHGGGGTKPPDADFPWEQLKGVPMITSFEIQQKNPVTADQIRHLAVIAPVLNVLNLGECTIPEGSWDLLPPGPNMKILIATLKNLTFLDIRGTNIGDAGLAKLQGLTALKEIQIERTKITAAGIAAFKKARPECEVVE